MLSYLLSGLEAPVPMILMSSILGIGMVGIIFLRSPSEKVDEEEVIRIRSKSI
jgi:hypothetical protein